ncbi:hypothetical protein [Roseobacter sinensis]|nr:hypothetical protein [Roseobacter sp. WL0113]
MRPTHNSFGGLSLLMDLNWDRALYLGTIALSLCAGAWISASFG